MTKLSAQTYRHGLSSRAMDDQSVANYYDSMVHAPHDEQVEISYVHFKHETIAQYRNIVHDLKIEPVWQDGTTDYKRSVELFIDIESHSQIRTRSTGRSGDYETFPADHPMLEPVGGTRYGLGNTWVQLNDIFRFVHDYHGHYGGENQPHYSFGPDGERSAWLRHRELYSREALLALWCETRGQSAWVNDFGDHRSLPLKNRPFAQQKAGFVPSTLR